MTSGQQVDAAFDVWFAGLDDLRSVTQDQQTRDLMRCAWIAGANYGIEKADEMLRAAIFDNMQPDQGGTQ